MILEDAYGIFYQEFQKCENKSLKNIFKMVALSLSVIFLLSDVVPKDWEVTQNFVTNRDWMEWHVLSGHMKSAVL